jgi:hypothetical protein
VPSLWTTSYLPRFATRAVSRAWFRYPNVCCEVYITEYAQSDVVVAAPPTRQDGTPGPRTPLTEYYFWPKVDAWEELKKTLDSKDWISETYGWVQHRTPLPHVGCLAYQTVSVLI